ncbi:MAG: hypothetical protein JO356_03170, partial [Acidobacteria bacterium]|nr:hypothetical protein [Acidobacteriota bacterium]
EEQPNRFKLTWKQGSMMLGLTVENSYSKWQGFRWWGSGFMLLLWFVLGLWLTRVLRQIFLIDVPKLKLPEIIVWKRVSDIPGNFLLIGLAKSGKSEWLHYLAQSLPKENCLDLCVELKNLSPNGPYPDPAVTDSASRWPGWLRSLADFLPKSDSTVESKRTIADRADSDRAVSGPIVLLDHFEFNLKDRDCNLVRLNLLEHLLYGYHCRIVLVSSVDPLYFLTESAPEVLSDPEQGESVKRLLDRWARVFNHFKKLHLPDSNKGKFRQSVREFIQNHRDCRQFALWVRQECKGTAMLREIGVGILDDFDKSDPVTREGVVSRVLEKAGDYYRVLWSGLTSGERLVLYQLALDGWANPKNTEALQQLESKSLLCRVPMYRVINESFRRFIICAEHSDEIAAWKRQEKQSAWHVLRLVMTGLAVMAGIWILHSQAALSHELAAGITGIATLLTAISGLFGRSGKQTSAKTGPR